MAWQALENSSEKPGENAAVRMTINTGTGQIRKRVLTISLRPAAMGCDWLKLGAFVSAYVGSGEHAGKIRLVQGKSFKTLACGGKNSRNGKAVMIKIPPPFSCTAGAKGPTAVDWEVVDGELIVTLPSWARGVADGQAAGTFAAMPPPAVALAAAAAPATSTPFKMGAPSHLEAEKLRGAVK